MLNNFARLICAESDKADAAVAPWIENSFPIIKIVLVCVLVLLAIAMIVFVCMQKSNQNGISAISGQTNTFYNRNKGATLQGKIKLLTIIDAVLILVVTIVFLILHSIYRGFI